MLFAAGGPSDVLARVLGERMRAALNQTVIVENVTGAGGTIGVTRAVRAPPDGYTVSFGHLGTHVINGAIYPLTFDLLNDLEPIGLIGGNPQMVVSKNAVPAKNLNKLIAWIKANEENVTFGTAGVGSGSHFSGLYFQSLIGTKARYVPYRGTGPAMQDLVAGNIDIIVDQASNATPQVQGGKIRALPSPPPPGSQRRRTSRRSMRLVCPATTSGCGPACGSQRNGEGRRRQAQRCDARGARRCWRAQALRRPRP